VRSIDAELGIRASAVAGDQLRLDLAAPVEGNASLIHTGANTFNFENLNVGIDPISINKVNISVNTLAVDAASSLITGNAKTLDFGAGINAAVTAPGIVGISVNPASITVDHLSSLIEAAASSLDFGAGINAAVTAPGIVGISINPASITLQNNGTLVDATLLDLDVRGNGVSVLHTGAGQDSIKIDAPAVTDGTSTIDPVHTMYIKHSTATQVGLDRADVDVGLPLSVNGAPSNPIMQGLNLAAGTGITISALGLTMGMSTVTIGAALGSVTPFGLVWQIDLTAIGMEFRYWDGANWVTKGTVAI
jgi:hypothetical protein